MAWVTITVLAMQLLTTFFVVVVGFCLINYIAVSVSICFLLLYLAIIAAATLNNLELLCYIHCFEVFQLEGSTILESHVFTLYDAVEVVDKMDELLIIDVGGMRIIERNDGYTI